MGIIYNRVPDDYLDTYLGYFDLEALRKKFGERKKGFRIKYAREHPVTFFYFMKGLKFRLYQSFAIDILLKHRRVALNWARRLGKSLILSSVSEWDTYFNKETKNQFEPFTEIGLISKEDAAAKKLLSVVRENIYNGDVYMRRVLKRTVDTPTFFSDKLIEPNNTEQITWNNRSIIRSLPPTKRVRQYGFSRLCIDEIAHLDPKDSPDVDTFYTAAAKPTIADTNGYLCISSTPKGKDNIFYKLFDPDGIYDSEFVGIWFNWEVNKDDANYRAYVETEKKRLMAEGKYNLFRQEFYGDFTVTQNSFYEVDDVASYFDKSLTSHYEWHKSPCSLGIDYGVSKSKTAIWVKTKYGKRILTIYHHVFPAGYDINEFINPANEDSIQKLNERYDLAWIIPDQCPQGDMINRWLIREGYPVIPYSFQNTTDKNKAYYKHRALLKSGTMKSYPIESLRHEMNTLQEEPLKKFVSIGKTRSGSDDEIDGDVFSTVPFFEDEGGSFGVETYEKIDTPMSVRGNVDRKWKALEEQGKREIEMFNKKKKR